VNRYVPRLEQLEPRTVPSMMVTKATELAAKPSAANALFGLLTANPSLQPQVNSAPTSSVVLTEQPTYQIMMLEPVAPGGLALYVSVPASADGSLANSITLSFNGYPVSTIPVGGSVHASQVQIAMTAQSGPPLNAGYMWDSVSPPGIMVMVSQNASSSVSPLTLTIASVKVSAGRVGILVAVAAGDSLEVRVILLVAAQAVPPPAQSPQNVPSSANSFVDTPATKPSEPPNAISQNPQSNPLSDPRLAIQIPPQVHGTLPESELRRRASTASAYVTWSGRDDPARTLKPASDLTSATSGTASDAGPNAAAVDLAQISQPLLRREKETEVNIVPVDTPVMGATIGLALGPEWLTEAGPGRRILLEDEPLDVPPPPRQPPRNVKARAGARGFALLAISITATWIFEHGYSESIWARRVLPRGERSQT
jgi:hypothetical protein